MHNLDWIPIGAIDISFRQRQTLDHPRDQNTEDHHSLDQRQTIDQSIDPSIKHTCPLRITSGVQFPWPKRWYPFAAVDLDLLLLLLLLLIPWINYSPGKDTARIANPSKTQIDGPRIFTAPCPPSQPLDSDPVSRLIH